MKLNKLFIPLAIGAMTLSSCTSDDPDEGKSVIVTPNEEQTDFDKWLETNYAIPYNIEFKYRYKETESDYNHRQGGCIQISRTCHNCNTNQL